jgi:imidazolonepropionase-like amidohydrolase
VHALENARIVVAPAHVIERGTVVIRDGVIEAVGADVTVPADARQHDLDGKTIYPGLIEAYAESAWPEPDDADDDSQPQGGNANAMVTPQRSMAQHAFDDSRFSRLRSAGFTTARIAPEQGIFRGSSALVNLGEGSLGSNLLAVDVAQNVTFRSNSFGGRYPTSLMGAEALFRQTILDARWYQQSQAAYTANKAQIRPVYDRALEALAPVIAGEMPLVVEADDALASLRWAHLSRELALPNLVLVGHGHEYERLEAIVATGLPILLPLELPAAPEVGDEDDGKISLADLRHWARAPDNPRHLLAAGATVALTSHRLSDPKKLHENLEKAIERGLSADDALAALTTVPAAMLGISDRAGTVEVGKMANLVVVDGDLMVASPKIQAVWVDGDRYEVKATEAPSVDPAGTWAMSIDAGPGGTMSLTLELTGTMDAMEGSIGTPAGNLPFQSVVVSGDTVEFELDGTPLGMPGMITFSMTVDGDSASGTGTAPPGPFTLKATRTSKPDSPEVIQ